MALRESFPSVLEAARAGEGWAVASLYESLQPRVFSYLRSRARQEAEDLSSEVWLDVARALPRFEGSEDDFRRLVFTIARRRLIDFRRRTAFRRTDAVAHETLADMPSGDDVESMAIEALSAEEARASIAAALTPDQAEVVLLRIMGGFSADEVAAIMGKRPGAVRVLQHRALAVLSKCYQSNETRSLPEAM